MPSSRSRIAKKSKKSVWQMGPVITSMDTFSTTVPQFDIDGDAEKSTLCGGITSFVIFMAALAYAASNAIELVSPRSPVINKVTTPKYFGNSVEEAFTLTDANFKLAFTLSDAVTWETKKDPRYIQWHTARFHKSDSKFS